MDTAVVYVRLSEDEWLVSHDREDWRLLRAGGEATEAMDAARAVFPRCLVAILGKPCTAEPSETCPAHCPGRVCLAAHRASFVP